MSRIRSCKQSGWFTAPLAALALGSATHVAGEISWRTTALVARGLGWRRWGTGATTRLFLTTGRLGLGRTTTPLGGRSFGGCRRRCGTGFTRRWGLRYRLFDRFWLASLVDDDGRRIDLRWRWRFRLECENQRERYGAHSNTSANIQPHPVLLLRIGDVGKRWRHRNGRNASQWSAQTAQRCAESTEWCQWCSATQTTHAGSASRGRRVT